LGWRLDNGPNAVGLQAFESTVFFISFLRISVKAKATKMGVGNAFTGRIDDLVEKMYERVI
jgi:hypothetical protein